MSPRAAAAASLLPIFFSSVLFMYFYYKGRPLLHWLGDVGLPSTDRGGGRVSRQTNATQVFTPQPVEWMFMNGMFVQSCRYQ